MSYRHPRDWLDPRNRGSGLKSGPAEPTNEPCRPPIAGGPVEEATTMKLRILRTTYLVAMLAIALYVLGAPYKW
ncbi:MAG: hypothetical protein M3276_07975 [Actinomycetota bacterium]|nr:hypothetical protein [Actinomycetota bacterium]